MQRINPSLIIAVAIALLAVLFGVMGITWLALGLLALASVIWLLFRKPSVVLYVYRRNWLCFPALFIVILSCTIAVRLFLLEFYSIPSESMEDTILPGDVILVEKLSYGPKLPETPLEIPWVNLIVFLNQKARGNAVSTNWGYRRLRGISPIKRNDILVFRGFSWQTVAIIKRCIALPGDTLTIRDGMVSINGQLQSMPQKIKHRVRVEHNNYAKAKRTLDSIGATTHFSGYQEGYLNSWLTKSQEELALVQPYITSIAIEAERQDTAFLPFPWDPYYAWNIDSMGPITLPYKGMRVPTTRENYIMYRFLLESIEGQDVDPPDSSATNAIGYYEFNQNYYFLLGDHRHASEDSRYWGPIPEEYVVGKASRVLFSKGFNGMRWGRTFRRVR